MKNKHLFSRRLATLFSGLDNHLVTWTTEHSNLLMAIVNLALAAWALDSGLLAYVVGMALVGAVAYFAGLFVAVSLLIITIGVDVALAGFAHILLSALIVEIIGYLNIAWLGFRHKRLKMEQRRTMDGKHPDQIMSWTAVNEVRTSLAAIRYLLFPMHSEHTSQELQKASRELSRLEQLFQDIETKQSTDGTHRS